MGISGITTTAMSADQKSNIKIVSNASGVTVSVRRSWGRNFTKYGSRSSRPRVKRVAVSVAWRALHLGPRRTAFLVTSLRSASIARSAARWARASRK